MAQCYPVNNYYLYSISHPDKCGVPVINLSNDPEAAVTLPSPTSVQLAIERVIRKTFTHYSIPLDISDKLRSTFKSKLWRMGKALAKLGGPKRSQQLKKWQEGKDSIWVLSVDEGEVNRQLLTRKRQVEQQLQNETCKRTKLESEIKQLQKTTQKQAATISKLQLGKCRNSRRSSKSWMEYSRQQRSAKKKALSANIKTAMSFCDNGCFQPVSMGFLNTDTGNHEVFDFDSGSFSLLTNSTISEDDKQYFALYVKDRFSLSDEAYHEMSMLSQSLPRSNRLKDLMRQLNTKYNITPAPNDGGVQQSLTSRVILRLQQMFVDPSIESKFASGKHVRIKLSGDGTVISRSLHVVNFTFTMLDESKSPKDRTIAILNIPEKYEDLAKSLEDICHEASHLDTIKLNGKTYKIELFMGGDMKFLLLIYGLDAANAQYSCLWCKCPASERWDMAKQWSFSDVSKGARTIEEIQCLSKLPKSRNKERFNCSRQPLFPCIPIDHVVIDKLHTFLRITDVLTNLLILELRRLDGIDKARCGKLDRSKHTNLVVYENFLNVTCKISFKWYTCEDSNQLKWRDLTGPEKLRLFNRMDIPNLFPSLPNGSKVQHVWSVFMNLMNDLGKPNCSAENFESTAKDWVREFVTIYQTKHVTPYIHALAMHIPEFIRRYGNVSLFSQQGLEKLNDTTTRNYFRSTNHRESEAVKQLMEKQNRLEYLEDEGYRREKRPQHCTICGQVGHNRRSCNTSPDNIQHTRAEQENHPQLQGTTASKVT